MGSSHSQIQGQRRCCVAVCSSGYAVSEVLLCPSKGSFFWGGVIQDRVSL